MGKFVYEGTTRTDFEDRLLAHMQVVIGNKLRRGEPFYFQWKDEVSTGGGRTSIVFKFHGGRPPALNRAWLEALMTVANSPTGLYVIPEPPEDLLATEPIG